MSKKTIVPLNLEPEDVEKLEWLMRHWNLDAKATIERAITQTVRKLKTEGQEAKRLRSGQG